MEERSILLDPTKCTGCRDCETACSLKRTGQDNQLLSCIRIVHDDQVKGFFLPVFCQHCSEPPCRAVCPQEAIYRDQKQNRVVIDRKRCVGCKMCFSACPFGAMNFDPIRSIAFKCDLCEGDPACIRVCETEALRFVPSDQMQVPQIETAACKFFGAVVGSKPRASNINC
jgi:Fe-S-cluster-containing hydrogenase component 2